MSKALDHGSVDRKARHDALDTFQHNVENPDNYHGVLKMMLTEERWQGLRMWAQSAGGGTADLRDELAEAFEQIGKATFSQAEKLDFMSLLRKGFSASVEGDGKKTCSRMMVRILKGLASLGSGGQNNLETCICDMSRILYHGGGETPLQELQTVLKRCKIYGEDVEVRCVFNVDRVLADLPEETAQKINEEPNFAMAIQEIKVSSASFACVKQLVTVVHNVIKIKLENQGPAGSADASGASALLKAWPDVSNSMASVSALGHEAAVCLQTLETALDLKAAGAYQFAQTVEPFKQAQPREPLPSTRQVTCLFIQTETPPTKHNKTTIQQQQNINSQT
jgi:hypothetical protein